MPEFPDVTVYRERLEALCGGERLLAVRLKSPFLLRTVAPPLEAVSDRRLLGVESDEAILGQPLRDLVHPDDHDATLAELVLRRPESRAA